MLQKIKKFLPYFIIISLSLVGILGYLSKDTGSPVRVLFRTKGGNVIFSHKTHLSDYGIECVKCHHDTGKKEYDCRKCHSKGTDHDNLCSDRAIHKQCIGANCIDCHKEETGMDEKNCKACHK